MKACVLLKYEKFNYAEKIILFFSRLRVYHRRL